MDVRYGMLVSDAVLSRLSAMAARRKTVESAKQRDCLAILGSPAKRNPDSGDQPESGPPWLKGFSYPAGRKHHHDYYIAVSGSDPENDDAEVLHKHLHKSDRSSLAGRFAFLRRNS